MAKLKTLAGNPPDFPFTVTMQNLNGEDIEIGFTGIGRTLVDWMPIFSKRATDEANSTIAAIDEQEEERKKFAEQDSKGEKRKPIKFNKADIDKKMQEGVAKGVALIREVAKGWDLDDEFNDANLAKLIAQFPGAQQKAHEQYHQRILGNRAKN